MSLVSGFVLKGLVRIAYESYDPNLMPLSLFSRTDVQAKILEGDTLQVRRDGSINLNCVINYHSNSSNTLILWYHNSNLLNYNKDVLTKSRVLFNKETGLSYLHSSLRINEADSSHAGNYTCELTNVGFIISSYPISVFVSDNPSAINYNAVENYNKHRALKEEFGILLDSSSTRGHLNSFFVFCSCILLFLLNVNHVQR